MWMFYEKKKKILFFEYIFEVRFEI